MWEEEGGELGVGASSLKPLHTRYVYTRFEDC